MKRIPVVSQGVALLSGVGAGRDVRACRRRKGGIRGEGGDKRGRGGRGVVSIIEATLNHKETVGAPAK